ncbi:MAG: hypothetical protein ABR520_04960 [Mycobacteriales bacterium]|nr:hypothetical protein [Frankia sp.]
MPKISENPPGSAFAIHIEHPARDWAEWKRAFDSDPASRARGGVRGYRVSRAIDDPNYVVIDLDFDDQPRAEAFLGALQQLWARVVPSGLITGPRGRVIQVVEAR